jgi:hypothetical protein
VKDGKGTWAGTWQPQHETQSPVSIHVRATDPALHVGEAEVSGILKPNLDTPAVADNGVVSLAAPFTEQAPLASGDWVIITGVNLATDTVMADSEIASVRTEN